MSLKSAKVILNKVNTIVTRLPGDLKSCEYRNVALVNTGTVTADVSATITLPHVVHVYSVVVRRKDANNSGVIVKPIFGSNKVEVIAQSVPATSTTYIDLIYIGF